MSFSRLTTDTHEYIVYKSYFIQESTVDDSIVYMLYDPHEQTVYVTAKFSEMVDYINKMPKYELLDD